MNQKYEIQNDEDVFNLNYYENIIQDLQYTNALINNRNLSLEKELEIIKNKYNLCKQDLNDINMHISICKDTQDKIIKDLTERNDYLEQLNLTKENKEINEANELSKKKNITDKIHNFIEKMKKLFEYDDKGNKSDEDYLDIIENNIIKINEELLLCKTDLNKKIHEINKLKHEMQNVKLYQNNYINNYNNNIPKDYNRVKTPLGHYKNKIKFLNNNKNIEIFPSINNSNSPKSLRNKIDNNISIPKTPQLNLQTFNDSYNKDISKGRNKNKKISIEKKLINSRSLNPQNFKTLKEAENERKYNFQRENLNNNENLNSDDVIEGIMNNVKHLEKTFNNRPYQKNNI